MLGIGDYLWRLVPANPILLRVVQTGGKRRRDLFIRCLYLGLLIAIVIFSLMTGSSQRYSGMSLTDLAIQSGRIFEQMSFLQLALVSLLAPIFTAGAITQEKDSQTYDILLSTPLTNGQIVLGSLLSRLFFIVALLISGIPIFSVTQIFGGVAIRSIGYSFLIATATAFVTGALAMAIATFKVGTRRTIFSFYLFVVTYLVGLFLLDKLPLFKIDIFDANNAPLLSQTSWLTAIHPFLALRVVINDPSYVPPELAQLPEHLRGWPWGWYLSSPHTFYINLMFFISLVLVVPSIVLLRRMAQSTISIKGWILQKLHLSSGDRTRKPRVVWHNPIAWREAKTKASAARASMLRYTFLAGGIVGALVLVILFSRQLTPAAYITAGSYDPIERTLFIQGDTSGMFKLDDRTEITLDGNEASSDVLRGRREVHYTLRPVSGSSVLATIDVKDIPRQLDAHTARRFLLGAVILEFAVILLIVTNAAASTVTREKEDGSLDLLLTTPITSRYYVWGKLRGLVSFVLPLLAVPVISVLLFVAYDMIRLMGSSDPEFQWIVFPEAVIIFPGVLVIVAAFASILGMQMSLRCRTTVRAVMSSVGIIIGLCALLGWCGNTFLTGMGRGDNTVGVVLASFSPFTVLTLMINPYEFGGQVFSPASDDVGTGRFLVLLFSWIAVGAYAAVVWAMYKSMVKNFDMTIRRQSR
jgi:ABC-type transport system involved in multi-copper enzyme maturation permease subunit